MRAIKFISVIALSGLAIGTANAQLTQSERDTNVHNRVSSDTRSDFAFSRKATMASDAAVRGVRLARGERPQKAIEDYLRGSGRDIRIANNMEVRRSFTSKFDRRHYVFEERVNGLRVYDSEVKMAIGADGSAVSFIENMPASFEEVVQGRRVDARAALRAAVNWNFPDATPPSSVSDVKDAKTTFSKSGYFYNAPTVEHVILRKTDGSLEYGAEIYIWSKADNLLYETVVDSRGRVIENRLRTAFDSYRVFPDHPGNSTQTTVNGPGTGNTESPSGWLSGTQRTLSITGNNAHAYLDTEANNTAGAEVIVVIPLLGLLPIPITTGLGSFVSGGDFLTYWNSVEEPSDISNQQTAVQNLFYYNNAIHDELYKRGFTETAGNFQNDNFGLGGAENDAVIAEAQDGSGLNNANFATPGDGVAPRMQMFLWDKTVPQRDSALDSDIVWHEYGHGLTWRMIGQMNGDASAAIGEGMSDVLAILMNDDDVVGEYSDNDSAGIRRYPYANYPLNLNGYIDAAPPHLNGEIYAATIWKLWETFQANSLSRDLLLDILVEGMNFTPADPDYLEMRTGLLAASTTTATDCHIWNAFASFGMGLGAIFDETDPPNSFTLSFTVPGTCP